MMVAGATATAGGFLLFFLPFLAAGATAAGVVMVQMAVQHLMPQAL